MKLNEQILTEQAVIDWFKELGYEYRFGPDITTGGILVERDFKDVILENRLRGSIKRLNPDLSEKYIDDVVYKIKKVENPNLENVNKEIYKLIKEGVKLEIKDEKVGLKGRIVKIIDFENPLNNEFLVVNQFTVQGREKIRRPDVVIFINGIPIAIFELKNPLIEEATIQTAYQQLQEYKKDIPEIFKYNQILVISDLSEAKYGTISSSWEWFKIWRGIENKDEKLEGVSELEVLIKGIFQKNRILDIIENFIVFEADSEKEVTKFTKKICLYHQYFGVNKTIQKTLKALKPEGDGRIGILWHTQGSGKTLEMVFYINKAKKIKELIGSTFVFLTDRNDLDNQFYKTFLKTGYEFLAKQAQSIKDLQEKLKTAGSELIFTTIQKFSEDVGLLSERRDIIVIADEAHRSEYAKLAANVRKSLPNASFLGITATPIEFDNRNTRLVFGDYIDIYSMSRSNADGATVPIYYESRLIPLHLTNYFIDEEFNDLTQEIDVEIKESLKRKFVKLEQAISVPTRLKQIAEDIVNHFNNRGIQGKAMVVTISRKVAVEMYKLISQVPDAPEVAVVISNLEEFKDVNKGEYRVSEIEKRFKNPDDSLRMVVVCDMWLTGFDVPHLHTMYFDKPLKNHGLMQAIARVNRVFKDKQGGLIVDYIGIADDLKKALNAYDPEIRKEVMISLNEIVNKMLEKYDVVKSMLSEINYSNWKFLEGAKLAQLLQQSVNFIITNPESGIIDEKRKERFLKESLQLIKLHSFVMPHKEAYEIKQDIDFFKLIRSWIIKQTLVKNKADFDIELETNIKIKELISKSITAEGIIEISSLKEKGKTEISILDDKFLDEIKKIKYKNLSIEILKKLLNDEVNLRLRKNNIRYKNLSDMLKRIIEEYEKRIINTSKTIEKLIELAKEIKRLDEDARKMNFTEEELAFYDIIKNKSKVYKDEKIRKIVKDLVKIIEKDLTIDWMNNEIIKSRIRDNIRRLLLANEFSPQETEEIKDLIYNQTLYLYKDYNLIKS